LAHFYLLVANNNFKRTQNNLSLPPALSQQFRRKYLTFQLLPRILRFQKSEDTNKTAPGA